MRLFKTKLLKLINNVTIVASTAHDSFSIEDLNIVWSNYRFDDEILSQMGKASKATTARQHKLLKDSDDPLILAELGAGDDPQTIALSPDQFRVWLQTAKHRWHVVYIQGKTEVLAVDVYWYGYGWSCFAYSISDPDTWFQGDVIVSRQNSNLGT